MVHTECTQTYVKVCFKAKLLSKELRVIWDIIGLGYFDDMLRGKLEPWLPWSEPSHPLYHTSSVFDEKFNPGPQMGRASTTCKPF